MWEQQRTKPAEVQFALRKIQSILVGFREELFKRSNASRAVLRKFETGQMSSPENRDAKMKLSGALRQMSDALAILDEVDAPASITNALDLAVARLEQLLGDRMHRQKPDQSIFEQLERELASTHPNNLDIPCLWEISPGG